MSLADIPISFDELVKPYHSGPGRIDRVPLERRPFIAWDGEGVDLNGPGKPQSYTLFGCSTGQLLKSNKHLHTFDLVDFMLDVGANNPTAYHVGFAFGYDANMILRSLSENTIQGIHKNGKTTLKRITGHRYHIQYIPNKWFSVSRFGPKYDRKKNPHDKTSVRVYDIFTFFGTSFIKAYENTVGPVPELIVKGKADRKNFASLSAEYVETYWRTEIEMLRKLAEELRNRMYGANLRIGQWHGPGALANYVNRKHGVKKHMSKSPDEVREASRYAYAGGRFEMFRLGRTIGPIYSLDINSAYPFAITKLPSLSVGQWKHVINPKKLARFGVYHVRLLPRSGGTFLERAVGPLFHRDGMGNISFPWITDGWYWSPEVRNLRRLKRSQYEILEGWEYTGWADTERPYSWVSFQYNLRRQWKEQGNASQFALKLMLNSLYGKMAQRVGWDEERGRAPQWHQLEWAGYTTSYCRAMLWDVMARIPREQLIAVETDGLYTTMSPTELGIIPSNKLGGWECVKYDEILYVQSGLAWLRKGDEWECKRRGLDARTFELEDCINYLHSLGANTNWEPFRGETTRFIGMGAALNSKAPFKVRHCVWQTDERKISPGQGGKRVHISGQCSACSSGLTAWEQTHEMSIRSLAYISSKSHPHDIPWENGDLGYEWREAQKKLDEIKA